MTSWLTFNQGRMSDGAVDTAVTTTEGGKPLHSHHHYGLLQQAAFKHGHNSLSYLLLLPSVISLHSKAGTYCCSGDAISKYPSRVRERMQPMAIGKKSSRTRSSSLESFDSSSSSASSEVCCDYRHHQHRSFRPSKVKIQKDGSLVSDSV